jgi:hypothetical protein
MTEPTTAATFTIPLSFERSPGTGTDDALYIARGLHSTIQFRNRDVTIAANASGPSVQMRLLGALPGARVAGVERLPTKVNYFLGEDTAGWRTNVPVFGRLRYEQVYPGVNLEFYGDEGVLEYDFLVSPGADPSRIRWQYDSSSHVRLDSTGDLLVAAGATEIRQAKPIAYQMKSGAKHLVPVRYALRGATQVAFEVGQYDRHAELVIDPVIAYSSYFGGAGDETGNAIVVHTVQTTDADNNAIVESDVYIAGSTTSTSILNTSLGAAIAGEDDEGNQLRTSHGQRDAFVSKLVLRRNGQGSVERFIEYTTYLGCNASTAGGGCTAVNEAKAVALLPNGEVIVGGTSQGGFPRTKDSFGYASPGLGRDCFVARLGADGSTLKFSALIGGSGQDECNGIAVTSSGEVVIVGSTTPFAGTYSFPAYAPTGCTDTLRDSSGNLRPTLSGVARNLQEAFVAKLAADGKCLLYTKYLGGNGNDVASAIVLGSGEVAYIGGGTSSTDIPVTPGGGQNSGGGGFLLQMTPDGDLSRFSYFGPGPVTALALDTQGRPFVVSDSGQVALVSQSFDTVASLALGSHFKGRGISVDRSGNAWLAGTTDAKDQGVRGAEQLVAGSAAGANGLDSDDAFVAKVSVDDQNPSTLKLRYASYLGGTAYDRVGGLSIDSGGTAFVVGTTASSDFPRTNSALQNTLGGQGDVFVRSVLGDADEDGIPDSWESAGEGIDLDRDGVVELDLAALGARPIRKDLFLEIDYFAQATADAAYNPHSHQPNRRIDGTNMALGEADRPLQRLVAEFASAPVSLPLDCALCMAGIALHFRGADPDGFTDDAIPETASNRTIVWAAGSGGVTPTMLRFGADARPYPACQGYFGTAADRANPPATCQTIRNAWFEVAHYVIAGHTFTDNNSGRGEIGGNDLTVVLDVGNIAPWGSPGASVPERMLAVLKSDVVYQNDEERVLADLQMSALMHELGHNLGLLHGGSTDVNCKPNYLSVMNYAYQSPKRVHDENGILRAARRPITYSATVLRDLDEDRLREPIGVQGDAAWDAVFSVMYPATSNAAITYKRFLAPANGPIDWNNGGTAYDPPGTEISSDVNVNPAVLGSGDATICAPNTLHETLSGFEDWKNLNFYWRAPSSSRYVDVFPPGVFYEVEPTYRNMYLEDPVTPRFTDVRITSTCNQVAPSTVGVEADVYDGDNNVTGVKYFLDGEARCEASASPYRCSLSVLQPGEHKLIAVVTDREGWSFDSEPLLLVFNAGTGPSLAITAPSGGTTYAEGAPIALSAEVLDVDGCVGPVAFFAGEARIGEGQQFALGSGRWLVQFQWANAPLGVHQITARVAQGDLYSSQPVEITVRPNVGPAVRILTPANNATVRGPADLVITAEATDEDGSVSIVEFFAGETKLGEVAYPAGNSNYPLPWSGVPLGTYVLTARARDNVGAVSVSAPISISVVSNVPPVVRITSPESNTTFRAPLWINGTFEMSDPDGIIAKTEFFINGERQWEWPAPQSYFAFKATIPGTYTVTIAGTDNEGAVTLSAPVDIVIAPPCDPPAFAGLTSVVALGAALRLEWPAATPTCDDYPVFYNVYRSTDPEFEPMDESYWDCKISGTSVDDTYSLEPGVTYYYIVRAIHSNPNGCFRSGEDTNLLRVSGQLAATQPSLAAFTLAPATLIGGASAAGSVTLSGPAPADGSVVTIQSSSTAVTLPGTVTVPAGATAAMFGLTTLPVASSTDAVVTATHGNAIFSTLTIQPPRLTSIELLPTSVVGAYTSSARISIDGPAPAGGITLTLTSANAAVASIPASAVIAAKATQGGIPVSTTPVSSDTVVVITASHGGVERSADLTVRRSGSFGGAVAGGPIPLRLPLLPPNNWWNLDISAVPVDPQSQQLIQFIGATRSAYPDFGTDVAGPVRGIPIIITDGTVEKKAVKFTEAPEESDGWNPITQQSEAFYPIPDEAITIEGWVEGGEPGNVDLRPASRRMLIVDKARNHLYELRGVWFSGQEWEASSGAFFDMNTNNRRPEGWRSADVSGLAVLPGLIRYEEVTGAGEIRHAHRVSLRATNGHAFPASRTANSTAGALPLGARLRLKASKDIASYSVEMQRILRAFKKYGLIVAEEGSDLHVSGDYDSRWQGDVFQAAFATLQASDFEVIELGWRPPLTFMLSLPSDVGAGNATDATIVANDANYSTATDYRGTVRFSATDGAATLPLDYACTAGDAGAHTFPQGVILRTSGTQIVSVADTADSTAVASLAVAVGQGAPPAPVGLNAVAVSLGAVLLSWSASPGADQYEIVRMANGGAFGSLATTASPGYVDTTVTPGIAYVYKVRAIYGQASSSGYSAPDCALTMMFTDDPIVADETSVKRAHVAEMRDAVNALRATANLSTATFTDPELTTSTPVKTVHVSELREALTQARDAIGLSALVFTDAVLTPESTVIRAVHVQEIREGMK